MQGFYDGSAHVPKESRFRKAGFAVVAYKSDEAKTVLRNAGGGQMARNGLGLQIARNGLGNFVSLVWEAPNSPEMAWEASKYKQV